MQLFILDRTPLWAMDKLAHSPGAGDVVVYLRPGQDPDGRHSQSLKEQGISSVWGETLLDFDTSWACDRIGGDFLSNWYRDGGEDLTRVGELSIGKMLDWQFGRLVNPMLIVRTGEIVRRCLLQYPEADTIYTDIADGEGIDRVRPRFRPLVTAVQHVGQTLGRPIQHLDEAEGLHPLIIRYDEGSIARVLIRIIGGLRPRWLWSRLRRAVFPNRNKSLPAVYVLMGRGIEKLVKQLHKTGRYRLFVDQVGVAGTEPLRFDHLLALPKLAEFRAAKNAVQRLISLCTGTPATGNWSLNGISYDRFLATGALAFTQHLFWSNLFLLAQARLLVNRYQFAGYIINGETGFVASTIVDLNRHTGNRIYHVGHSLNVFRSQSTGMAYNSPHVTYFASGTDQISEYGVHLPDDQKPRRLTLGNPLTVVMNPVRNRLPKPHGKRILILGTGFAGHATASRARSAERHLADAFLVARSLAESGWKVTYRGHPHHPLRMEKGVARAMDMEDQVTWDRNPEFSDSLLEHDVVITALSSTFYQSLWAGWPTIYYDPKFLPDSKPETFFRDEIYLGLPVAHDIEWPVSHDTTTLKQMIVDSCESNSLVSSFPGRFSGAYRERFIGPSPEAADQAIADFIVSDLDAASETP